MASNYFQELQLVTYLFSTLKLSLRILLNNTQECSTAYSKLYESSSLCNASPCSMS